MSIYTVDMMQPSGIDFAPATTAAEVAQNIRTILKTSLGSAPLARDIGLDYSIIDDPYPIAQARLMGEIMTAVAEQEPRAVVTEVSFKGEFEDVLTGRLLAVVRFSLAEGVQ
ncbi:MULTISPECIES: lysozyme [unclassified Paenibacillus]|uniref:lysozyme n=1 Tax=unclassified Paenibacillus TaxID=185978 RepID=UPI0024050091|nr:MULTISPECIES: lysozyme [unclassified Paenibacillus]MDF9845529.1 phage baseplate assembly protein W [Paenibacillus sp. PastF-2]MDF9852101.1 phage baseplate assembly protein W [Paenibacillus sp. PastM-2]MDF9858691.1 phage baseplate assembly protein W [Paenibacillus sp. PastF-1]MDH6483938.1 phage baseplate assembly protein W [Paenibacillus sp. PastH-2]MDH6511317.1 phage baseplate assembly protein W [Paenibacillus sp. PastM-3]